MSRAEKNFYLITGTVNAIMLVAIVLAAIT